MSRGDRSRPGRERSAEERERDRQERARQRALRAGEPPPDEPVAPSLEELSEQGELVADQPGVEAAKPAGGGELSGEGEPFAYQPGVEEPKPAGAGELSGEDQPFAHPPGVEETSAARADALPWEDEPVPDLPGAAQEPPAGAHTLPGDGEPFAPRARVEEGSPAGAGPVSPEGEPFAYPSGVEAGSPAGAGPVSPEGEPFVSPPSVREAKLAGADAPSSPDATAYPASDRAHQTSSAAHEPIVPAPKERPYPEEDPAYARLATPEPVGTDDQPSISPPPPPPPLPPPASRAAPERSGPPPESSRRSRSMLARLAAVFALAAVVAALLLLFHSLSSKPAAKVAAAPTVVKVVIPEGKTRPQIAQIASVAGLTGSYRGASRHSPLLNPAHYGAPHGTPDLEGFLFPATYDMDKGAPVSRLVQEQLVAFRENFGAEELARARALHVTPYDLLIVASMVEREAQVPGDRSKIAAVVYNRLREGMPLGIDATIYYAVELAKGIPTYTHELSEAQLHIDSPYNTRIHAGLPPTPISNPGLASIHAAAHPAQVSYLYYVAGADGCGEQVFSNTLAEFEVHSAAYKAAVEKNGGHPPSCKHTLTGTPSGAQAGK